MYKTVTGGCAQEQLTESSVDVHVIAQARGQKVYVVRGLAAPAKTNVQAAVVIDRYATFVRESHPHKTRGVAGQTVNGKANTEGDPSSSVLSKVFGLTTEQQALFWEPERFEGWRTRNQVGLSLSDLRQALMTAKL